MNNNKYNQGDRVYFKLGDNKPEGWAVVEGVMGWIIIVKPEVPIKNYDYTHIYVVENQIVEENQEKTKTINSIVEAEDNV